MDLTGKQKEQLSKALRSAFNRDRLERLVSYRLDIGRTLEDVALADSFEQVVFDLIELGEAEGWTAELVSRSREMAPGNPNLLAFAQGFGLASTDEDRRALEQTIRKTNSFLDVNAWREALGRAEPCVCRVEVKIEGGMSFGTGFLVASSLVMTNYHVVEPVIIGAQGATPGDVVLRFDYKRTAAGDIVNPGVEHRLADEWLETSSPLSDADLRGAGAAVPAEDELDFVLLRLTEPAGDEPVGGHGEPDAETRGWLELPSAPHDFVPSSPIFILQHPQGTPLKLALDTEAVISVNGNGTRVLYRTNTEPGSSGSPCFDQNWQLVALHHSGDPNFDNINQPEYNRGIPIAGIRRLIEARGLADALGAEEP